MSFFEIEIDRKEKRVVGSDQCTTLTLQFVYGSDHPEPWISAEAYHREGDNLKSRHYWNFDKLSSDSSVKVNLLEDTTQDKPNSIEQRRGKLIKDKRLYVKDEVAKLKRMNKARELREQLEKESDIGDERFCGFCGELRENTNILFAGPIADICDECAKLCCELATENENR